VISFELIISSSNAPASLRAAPPSWRKDVLEERSVRKGGINKEEADAVVIQQSIPEDFQN